jgi:hypothetical protein
MEHNNNAMYIATLEGHINFLQHTLQEWRPHVPEAIVRKSQALGKSTSLFTQLHSTTNTSVQQSGIMPHSKTPDHEARWKLKLRNFISKIPTAPEWTKKVIAPDSPVLGVLFQTKAIATHPRSVTPAVCDNIIQTVQQCALSTDAWIKNAKSSKLIASYSKIIFCALCHVACCNGVAPKEVDEAMVTISNGSSTHLKEIRYGVTWAIEAIDRLHMKGWGIRSGDILFHCKFSFIWQQCNISKSHSSSNFHFFTILG